MKKHEFPKWVTHKNGNRLVVKNARQEKACTEGTAILREVKSAQGSVFSYAGREKPQKAAKG